MKPTPRFSDKCVLISRHLGPPAKAPDDSNQPLMWIRVASRAGVQDARDHVLKEMLVTSFLKEMLVTSFRTIRALWVELVQARAPAMANSTPPMAASPFGFTSPHVGTKPGNGRR